MKIKHIALSLLTTMTIVQAVNVGDILPDITLDKSNGGNSAEQAWHSKSLKGKVHLLLYMDPDKRKETMSFINRLNLKKYDKKKYSTVAIVNLAATWIPDIVLEKLLAKKQRESNNTEFVFDKTKYLVKKWKLKDDASNVLVCDKNEKILYQKSGKLTSSDVRKIMNILSKNIN